MIVDIRDLRLRAQEYFSKYAAGTRTLRLWALSKYFPTSPGACPNLNVISKVKLYLHIIVSIVSRCHGDSNNHNDCRYAPGYRRCFEHEL